jgi:hypothetical protein
MAEDRQLSQEELEIELLNATRELGLTEVTLANQANKKGDKEEAVRRINDADERIKQVEEIKRGLK